MEGDRESKRHELEALLRIIERRREEGGDPMLGAAVEARVRKRLKELDRDERGKRRQDIQQGADRGLKR